MPVRTRKGGTRRGQTPSKVSSRKSSITRRNPTRGRSDTLTRIRRNPTRGRSLTQPKVAPVPTPTVQPSPNVTTAPVAPTPSPTPDQPVTPGPGAEEGTEEAAGGVDIAAIEAAITAIEAQFGLTREQLLADESEIGRTYRLLIAQVNRAREASVEAVLGNAVDRGIVRSGIFAENVTEVEQLSAESVADLSSQQAAQQAGIQNAIAAAQSSAAQAKLTAAQQRGGQVLSQEELEALLRGGLA